MISKIKKKKKKKRYWIRSLLKRRVNYGTEELLYDLSIDVVGLDGDLRSSTHNFARLSSTDFELLIIC